MAKGENIKIQGDRVIDSPILILPEGHPLIEKLKPGTFKVIPGNTSNFLNTKKLSPFPSVTVADPGGSSLEGLEKDAPDLSDIENIDYVNYFDPVSKIEKLKVIIRVRNSSKRKSDVVGVDARVYQPRGAQ